MDFIEKLPPSSGYDNILIIVERLTKQSIFVPTVDTITAPMPAQLFVLHVFSKHGVLLHVTSDHGLEFVSLFFWTLGKALDMKLHFTSGYHPEGDGQAEQIKPWSNTSKYTATTNRTIGRIYSPLPNLLIITPLMPPLESLCFFANKGYHPSISACLD